MPYELLEDEQQIDKDIGRFGARTASNIATRAVGLPGDIFSLINEFIVRPGQKAITGREGVPYQETYLGKALPTTETHRKGIESRFGDFTKPKNKIEKFADDVIEDTATLFDPRKIAKKSVKGLDIFRNLAKSLGANLAGETVKQNTRNENAGNWTKAGSLFILSLLDKESAAQQVGKLYSEANANLPSNAKTSAKTLTRQIDNLEHNITKKRPKENLSPPEKFVIDQTDKIRNLIKDGEINIEQAISQKKSLYKELGTLYKNVPKLSEQKNVKNLAKQIGSFINDSIGQYGKTNPQFYKPYKNADDAFGTLAKSNFLSQWVENNVIQHPVTSGLIHLFGPVSGATATAILPYQAVKLSYRIAKSPTLAKIYAKTTKAAIKEDAITFNKYLKELDNALQKEENNDRYEFID
jgi:hypothetical protein